MKKPKFEILVKSKSSNAIFLELDDNEDIAMKKAKTAAKKGFACLVISHKNGKKIGKKIGPEVDWSKFSKVIEVTFGGYRTYTYLTTQFWETGDARSVETSIGISHAVVVSDARYVHVDEIVKIENRIRKELTIFEEVIIE